MEVRIRRLLSTSSYRELNQLERAMKLVEDDECSYRVAAKVCSVKKNQIESGIKAKRKGRAVGKVGRPHALTPAQEESVAKKLQEKIDKGLNPTFKEFTDMVCYFVFSLFNIVSLLSFDDLQILEVNYFYDSAKMNSNQITKPILQKVFRGSLECFGIAS